MSENMISFLHYTLKSAYLIIRFKKVALFRVNTFDLILISLMVLIL